MNSAEPFLRKSEPIHPADDASGILRCGPNDAPAASCAPPLKPLPHEPATLAELADAFRGLTDVLWLVISALLARGFLDPPDIFIDSLVRQAAIMRKREFRAGPPEFFVQEIPELLRTVDDMIARTAPAPASKQ
jgi:hypothetical protein